MILPYENHRSLGHSSIYMLNSNLDIWPKSGAKKNNGNIFEHRRSVTTCEIRDSLGIVSPKDASVVHLSCWMIRKKQAVSADVTLIKLRQRNTVKRKLHNSFVSTSLRSDDDNAFKRTRSFTKPNKHGIRTMPSGSDSSRDLLTSPVFYRSLNFWKGHVFTIQKRVTDFWSINVYKMGAKHDRPIDMARKYMGFIVFGLYKNRSYGPLLTTDCWAHFVRCFLDSEFINHHSERFVYTGVIICLFCDKTKILVRPWNQCHRCHHLEHFFVAVGILLGGSMVVSN